MKICMINDAAHVGSDLAKFLPPDITVDFIFGNRSFFGKTFGAFWNVFTSKNCDVYHANYALQYAYLVDKLKHLDILHVHGSDVRWVVDSFKYGWVVKYALKHADKVLYATPDLETKVKKYRPDAIYLPTPVDVDRFTIKTVYNIKPKALYFKQWYESIKDFSWQIGMIKRRFDLTIQERNIDYSVMPDFLKSFDIFIDRFSIPSFSKTCLEAMSCGLATIDYRHYNSLNSLRDRLEELKDIQVIGWENRLFVENNHNAKKIALVLANIYRDSFNKKRHDEELAVEPYSIFEESNC